MSGERYNACTELLDRNIEAGRATKIAFADPHRQLSYGQLQTHTRRFANFLQQLGLRLEDRIVLLMQDTVDWPLVFLGALRAGIVAVPVNTMLPPAQIAYMLKDSRARALFVSENLLSPIADVLPQIDTLEHVVICGGDAQGSMLSLEAEVAKCSGLFDTVETSPDESAFWLYSSGSTGSPKGTRHVHTSLMATADLYAKGVLGIREDDVCLSAAKLFFAYGLGNALTFPMSVGATAILNPDRPTPALMFDMMESFEPTIFFGVPTLYAAMLGDPSLADKPGSQKLRISASAGEALPEHVGSAWKKRFGSDILDGVGSTEMLHIFLSNHPGDVVYGTSGMAVPGYDLRLLDEAEKPVDAGEIGELYVRGASAADGYWNQREKSRATFQGDWTRTGDKYTCDETGRYTYCGRADDMFKVSGIWVSPFEVETALASHEAVLEAAVVPATDSDGLLKPKAYVVLKEGVSPDGVDKALQVHVKQKAGNWKYPRWVEIVESLPKTATGKIQRFKLREDA